MPTAPVRRFGSAPWPSWPSSGWKSPGSVTCACAPTASAAPNKRVRRARVVIYSMVSEAASGAMASMVSTFSSTPTSSSPSPAGRVRGAISPCWGVS